MNVRDFWHRNLSEAQCVETETSIFFCVFFDRLSTVHFVDFRGEAIGTRLLTTVLTCISHWNEKM